MIKTLYEKAHDYYKTDLKGQGVSTAIGDVHFSGKTWKKMRMGMKSDNLKAHLFMKVKDILIKGDYLGKTVVNKDRTDFVAFHFFMLKNIEIDGKIVDAGINVGEKENEELVYFAYNLGHSLRDDWKKKVEYYSDSAKVSKLNDTQLDSIIANNEDDVNIYVFNIRDKETVTSSEPPKGYIRSLVPSSQKNTAPDVLLFKENSVIETVKRDDIGDVLIFQKDKQWYGHFKKYGYAINGGYVAVKSLEQLVTAITNLKASLAEDWSKELKQAPKPFEKIIPKETISKLKKMSRNLHGRLSAKHGDTQLMMVKDGIATFADGTTTIVSKIKVDIPDIHGMSIAELRSIMGEIYILDDGSFSDGKHHITTNYDWDKAVARRIETTDLTIPITADTRKTLQVAVKAVDTNNPKFELNGLLIDVKDGKGKAVGTDTRRLTISKEFKVKGKDGQYIILPNHITKETKSIEIDTKTNISKSETDELIIYAGNIHGKYPEYERIIPQYPKNKLSFDGKELAKILKSEKNIIMEVAGKELVIYPTIEREVTVGIKNIKYDTLGNEVGAIKIDSKEVKQEERIGLNSKYLYDAIKDSKEVALEYNDPYTPILVTTDEGKTVIMPFVIRPQREAIAEEQKKQNELEKKQKEHDADIEKQMAELEAKEKEEEGIAHDFLNTLTPQRRGSAKKTLSGMTRYDGEVLDNRDFIVKLIKEGRKPEYKEYKEWSRRLDKNIEKSEWGMQDKDGSWVKVTKTEADFAQYLIDNNVSLDAIFSYSELQKTQVELDHENFRDKVHSLGWTYSKTKCKGCSKTIIHTSTDKIPFDSFDDARAFVESKIEENITQDAITSIETEDKHIVIGNLEVTIESQKGTVRSGTDENGNDWANTMIDDYGYFNDTHGNDGDEIDVFVSSDADIKDIPNKPVFYLKQNHKDNTFDEDKFILGTSTLKEAQKVYYRNYDKGYKNSGSWHEVEFSKLDGLLKKLSGIYIKKEA